MKMFKILSVLALLLVSVLAMSNVASAVSATIDEVKLDGDTLSPSSNNAVLDVDRDQELEVRVRFTATANQDNVQVEAAIRGYDHGDLIEDITDAFDVKTGNSYIKKLTLPLRERMDQGKYLLRVRIEDRAGATVTQTYTLDVDTERHNLQVYDVVLSPGETVNAGRALLAAVRVRNRGEKDEKNVKVTVSIPELGVSASDFIDEIEKSEDDDDETTSEELYLRIPDDAETGDYTLVTELQYDLGDEYVTQEQVIRVVGSEKAMEEKKEKTILTVAADAQSLQAGGAEVAYPITLTNAGSTLMGVGTASGENRATTAARTAIASPLLDSSIDGARGLLFNITGGSDMTMSEVDEAAKVITTMADPDAQIIFGAAIDEKLIDQVKVTVVATGFDESRKRYVQITPPDLIGMTQPTTDGQELPIDGQIDDDQFEVPTFLREIR